MVPSAVAHTVRECTEYIEKGPIDSALPHPSPAAANSNHTEHHEKTAPARHGRGRHRAPPGTGAPPAAAPDAASRCAQSVGQAAEARRLGDLAVATGYGTKFWTSCVSTLEMGRTRVPSSASVSREARAARVDSGADLKSDIFIVS